MKWVLVVFETEYNGLYDIDTFEIDDFVTLKYFVDNFEKFGHIGFGNIANAYIITESCGSIGVG